LIKANITKDGSSVINVLISKIDTIIDEGTIRLLMVVDRKNATVVGEQPYNKMDYAYTFDLSDNAPYNIGDYDYKVEVESADGSKKEESRTLRLFGGAPTHIRGAIKKVRNDFKIVSKKYNGSVVYLFKRIPGQEKCPVCWDEDLQSSNNSNCPECGGTGFVTYYANPYKTYAGPMHWDNETFSTEDAGKVMQNPTVQVSTIADFVLMENDLIYYVKTGDWLRVKARTVSELQTYPVLQTFIAATMPSDSPEVEKAKKLLGDKI
jgi:hypothetical protein